MGPADGGLDLVTERVAVAADLTRSVLAAKIRQDLQPDLADATGLVLYTLKQTPQDPEACLCALRHALRIFEMARDPIASVGRIQACRFTREVVRQVRDGAAVPTIDVEQAADGLLALNVHDPKEPTP